ncbi:hypothetical protein [Ruminococcus flavefaciens]|uniref:Uncharacterized protein n=1 Tax=Ruminococcus flavefaciens 007c TaxID=1341157 RepID=W7UE64_RUMFL|nr:hypothetical protein [Ruminococcus flavefaciens]EWM53446.1 hypothetical protein RF007C_07115 [Ruminococcus flavefaciens 007c]
MKKISTYLPSLIISVLLVFVFIISSAAMLVDINISSEKLKGLVSKKELEPMIISEVGKYYADKYNTSGIPADVYTDAIDNEYIRSFEMAYIDSAFNALKGNGRMVMTPPSNKALEENIEKFFNDFAEENNYEKDDKFEQKLQNTKDNAYAAIGSFCDVYKFSAMNDRGVLKKLALLYSNRIIATVALLGATLLLILLLIAVNHKKRITAVYWCGISAIIAGVMGGTPSIYLIATKYFDSFIIKQAPVFTAFTSVMYKLTEAFTAVMIAFIVIGITLSVIYGVTHEKKKYPNTKPTDIK